MRRPRPRASVIACSTDSRPAKPKPTTMSPICCEERPRGDGGVRPGVAGAAGRRAPCPGYRQERPRAVGRGTARASSAWLTSASASAFWARGTVRTRQRAKRRERVQRRRVQRLHVRVLDLVLAVDLLGDELGVVDDLDLVGAERAARGRARAAGRGTRRRCSSRRRAARGPRRATSPSGVGDDGRRGGRPRVAARAAVDVDDELHAPTPRRSPGTPRARARRRRSRDASLLGGLGGVLRAALALAAVDDDRDVRVVLVVLDELVVELAARAPPGTTQ